MAVPPKVFSGGEVFRPFEIDSNDNIVIEFGSFDSSPELELLMLVLMAKFKNGRLKFDDLFGG